jgi:Uma2 family endonuclease
MLLGWLIDPAEHIVMVFWPDRPLAILEGQANLPVLPDMDLTLTAAQVFAWAQ